MKKEKVLVNARYQVVTFRGYQYCETSDAAKKAAEEMIEDIANGGWDSTYWWARIIDIHVGISKIVYRHECFSFSSTPWISLR